jgi:hypothetical protein
MSTHDVFRAAAHANRIGIMRAGVLVRELVPGRYDGAAVAAIYADCMGTEGDS